MGLSPGLAGVRGQYYILKGKMGVVVGASSRGTAVFVTTGLYGALRLTHLSPCFQNTRSLSFRLICISKTTLEQMKGTNLHCSTAIGMWMPAHLQTSQCTDTELLESRMEGPDPRLGLLKH